MDLNKNNFNNIKPPEHGGIPDGLPGIDYNNFMDFSANISPFGVPDGVRAALENLSGYVDVYPDPLCRRLRNAIADAENIPPEWILCGNGVSDLIWRIALTASREQYNRNQAALVAAPSFTEYEHALKACGKMAVKRYNLYPESNFYIKPDFISWITGDVSLIFLCQPNNPTGIPVRMELAYKILNRCRETGARLIWDECFLPFMDNPENYTLYHTLAAEPNLIILRAFTKLYGMAGVRLGYAICSDVDYLERLRQHGPPWSVSYPAQEAGIAALKELNYISSLRAFVARERPRMYQELKAAGLSRVIPGAANFLLFQSPVILDDFLRQKNIFLRNCGNFKNLDAFWYRASIRTEEENNRLVSAIREAMGRA